MNVPTIHLVSDTRATAAVHRQSCDGSRARSNSTPVLRLFSAFGATSLSSMNARIKSIAAKAHVAYFRWQQRMSPSATEHAKRKSIEISAEQAAVQAEVAKSFVCKKHMDAIAAGAKAANCIISVRESGEHTLNKLSLGAPAKGHDILEKTIKEKSIGAGYPLAQAAVSAALKNADLLGYVGKWDDTGKLLGLYIGPDHPLGGLVRDGIYDIELNVTCSDGIYRVDMDKLNASLAPLKAQENWQALPYTGDYDLHDMISLYGQRATVPSNSDEEGRIINYVNAYIAAFDEQRSFKPIEYNTVRHGAQVSYVAFSREKKEPIVPQVAKSDFPLAFIYKGEWTIVRNSEEHLAFYKKVGAKMKFPWLPRTAADNYRRDSR